MKPPALPRIVLLVALAVFAGSLTVFAGVTGVISATPSDAGHEFAIDDGQLVDRRDGPDRTLLDDLSTVERIEISRIETNPVIVTKPREPAELGSTRRKRAKRIVTTAGPTAETFSAPDGAVYTFRPIPTNVSSEKAAIVGANPDTTWDQLSAVDDTVFTVRDETASNTVVFERTDRRTSTQRALVVIEPIEGNVQYSVVVNLQTETIEAFVRLDGDAE